MECQQAVGVVDCPQGEHGEEESPQALGSRPAQVRQQSLRPPRVRPKTPEEQSIKEKSPEQPRVKEEAPEEQRAKEEVAEQQGVKKEAPEEQRQRRRFQRSRSEGGGCRAAGGEEGGSRGAEAKEEAAEKQSMKKAPEKQSMKKAPEKQSMKKAPEEQMMMVLILIVIVVVIGVMPMVWLQSKLTHMGMAQEGKPVEAKTAQRNLMETSAPTKEAKMRAEEEKPLWTRVLDTFLEMLKQTMTTLLEQMPVEQQFVVLLVLLVATAVVAVVVAMAPRLTKEHVQDDIMMVLCSIAEERRKKIAKKQNKGFWDFFAEKPKETAEEADWGPLDAWISRLSKPIPQALMELPADKKQKLLDECKGIIRDLKSRDDKMLNRLFRSSDDLKQQLMWKLKKYLNE